MVGTVIATSATSSRTSLELHLLVATGPLEVELKQYQDPTAWVDATVIATCIGREDKTVKRDSTVSNYILFSTCIIIYQERRTKWILCLSGTQINVYWPEQTFTQ